MIFIWRVSIRIEIFWEPTDYLPAERPMLDFIGQGNLTCDGVSRRTFLRVGTLALGGLTLPGLLKLRAAGGQSAAGAKKSVILIWQAGGPSHIDMYDLKPNAPAEVRGEFKPIDTNVPGI